MTFRRYTDDRDTVRLARRVASMIAYGMPKQGVADTLAAEGVSQDDAFLAYAAAKMILEWENER